MCVDCTHSATAYVTFLVIVGVGALGALAIFARLSFRHPHARKRWISSALLLVTHAQALALLSYLHLAWPPAVQLLVDDVLSLNIFNVQAASCVFGNPHSFSTLAGPDTSHLSTTGSANDMYSLVVVSAPLFVLLSLLILRAMASWRGKADTADRAELALTLVFSFLLAFGWSVIVSVIKKTILALQVGRHAASGQQIIETINEDGWSYLGDVGTFSATNYYTSLRRTFAVLIALVAVLLALLLGLAVHFAVKIRRYQGSLADSTGGAARLRWVRVRRRERIRLATPASEANCVPHRPIRTARAILASCYLDAPGGALPCRRRRHATPHHLVR